MAWKPLRTSGVEPEDAVEVDVALDGRGHLGQLDAAGGGDVGEPGREAAGERVEQVLDRGRAVVRADEDRGVVDVEGRWPARGCAPRPRRRSRGSCSGCGCRTSSGWTRGTGTGPPPAPPSRRRGWRTGWWCRRRCGRRSRWWSSMVVSWCCGSLLVVCGCGGVGRIRPRRRAVATGGRSRRRRGRSASHGCRRFDTSSGATGECIGPPLGAQAAARIGSGTGSWRAIASASIRSELLLELDERSSGGNSPAAGDVEDRGERRSRSAA